MTIYTKKLTDPRDHVAPITDGKLVEIDGNQHAVIDVGERRLMPKIGWAPMIVALTVREEHHCVLGIDEVALTPNVGARPGLEVVGSHLELVGLSADTERQLVG
jgi:hypothetical protein